MKIVKRIIATTMFVLLFLSCAGLFRYIVVDDVASYTRIMMNELYNQDENIDVLFVGSSHCYRSFDTEVTDKIFQRNTFNAGSSSQHLDTSYTLIKEVAKKNELETVYLELYFGVASGYKYRDRSGATEVYMISDYMKPSINKFMYLLKATQAKHYVNSFVLARRSWERFFDLDYIMKIINVKRSDDYKNNSYTYVTYDNEYYAGKGYVASLEKNESNYFFSNVGYSKLDMSNLASQDWTKYLYKIIDYCERKDIKLVLVSAPVPDFILAAPGNYDEYITKVNTIIANTNVEYYDFNLCRQEYFPYLTLNFKDTDHLNSWGADLFSTVFARFFTGQISNEELFYKSYKEKLESLSPMILGLCYKDLQNDDTGEMIRNIKIVSTRENTAEYKILIKPENFEQYQVQDFTDNILFSVPADEHGVITITMRLMDNPDYIVQMLDIQY